ncbi:MAG: D-alanyl-D-alanine carboxypeptidase family protein [Anaerolineae bacterium]|nr:D-alanyl-D-alanine carboxypeptidase family protein [Gloeobacterales cyanobacterium ES-bin-313]
MPSVPQVSTVPNSVPQVAAEPTSAPKSAVSSVPTNTSLVSVSPNLSVEKYGHLPYQEASQADVELVGSYGLSQKDERYEFLHKEASHAWLHMQFAARDEGVWLIIISGFRTEVRQTKVFLDQLKKKKNEAAAARYVAPPGFSEHHTGYTLDLGDGSAPKTDLKTEFERTKAFRWLTKHAQKYGFEMSFGPNQKETGVAYEPWHWRYIGTSHALAIFDRARKKSLL